MEAKLTQAIATVQIDNERVSVTEWKFAPGAETGWHRHQYDYVVVPQTSGKLLLKTKDGDSESQLTSGKSYFRKAGVEHNVINASGGEFVFIEIELKT
jgi:quercetin dioxygenase-like cupin family protein